MKREQLSIPIDAKLRKFVESAAASEDRSVAAWVRHLVANAARQANHQNAEVAQ